MDQAAKPRVLVAPLDWGLGHASRCIPLIRRLIYKNYRVFLAGNERIRHFLEPEFSTITWLPLQGYNISYPSGNGSFALKMAAQIPNILKTIRIEHKWLQEQIGLHQLDAVISDNRYGLWSPSIPSIFITHQLRIQSGRALEGLVQALHYRFINRFTQCWVPDAPNSGLAGVLSHPSRLPAIPVRYLGTLSRFEYQSSQVNPGRILALLSGPEPQRTLLEERLRPFLENYPGESVLLRGLPGVTEHPSASRLRIFNHLEAPALAQEISRAEYVICRSGYSSLMDLERFQSKLLLIPTPGQTEQEFLACKLAANGQALMAAQNELNMEMMLNHASTMHFNPLQPSGSGELLDAAIDELGALISKH